MQKNTPTYANSTYAANTHSHFSREVLCITELISVLHVPHPVFQSDSYYCTYVIKAHSKMSSASKKKTRQYPEEYLKFWFIPAVQDERIPFCLFYQQFLSNESIIRDRLEAHLKAKHSAHNNSDLSYFKNLKENFEKKEQQ
ncbi:hypothetical protein TNCV_278101 [Trichonephila clavipes]|nr:hypothetical protein TNCV_278101 [Trichonephila clavipes]